MSKDFIFQRLGCLFRAWLPNYARLLSSVSSQLKMAASNSMNVDLTGSQPSELVEGASTRLTRDACSRQGVQWRTDVQSVALMQMLFMF